MLPQQHSTGTQQSQNWKLSEASIRSAKDDTVHQGSYIPTPGMQDLPKESSWLA